MAEQMPALDIELAPAVFEEQLREYADSASLGREDSTLLRVADALRTGVATNTQVLAYKAAAYQFIQSRLRQVDPPLQEAFLQFLMQSEIINDAAEIRAGLNDLLQHHSTPLDPLSVNIVSSLLRSNKPPSLTIARSFLGQIRAEYRAAPDWRYVGLLAALVGRSSDVPYTAEDLISDIALLANTADFERRLTLRNALWAMLSPRLDAIAILTRIRRNQPSHRHNYPATPNFNETMDRFVNSVVVN